MARNEDGRGIHLLVTVLLWAALLYPVRAPNLKAYGSASLRRSLLPARVPLFVLLGVVACVGEPAAPSRSANDPSNPNAAQAPWQPPSMNDEARENASSAGSAAPAANPHAGHPR